MIDIDALIQRHFGDSRPLPINLLDTIRQECLWECLRFLEANLGEDQRAKLETEIAALDSLGQRHGAIQLRAERLRLLLQTDPLLHFRLEQRLSAFIARLGNDATFAAHSRLHA